MARYVLNLDTNELQPLPQHQERTGRSQIGKIRIQARGFTDAKLTSIYQTNGFDNIAIFPDRRKADKFQSLVESPTTELTNRGLPVPNVITQTRLLLQQTKTNVKQLIRNLRDRFRPEPEEEGIWQIFLEDYDPGTGVRTNINVFVQAEDVDSTLDNLENWEPTMNFLFESQPIIGEAELAMDIIHWTNTKNRIDTTYQYDLQDKRRLN